jgi:DUF971 family protein
MTGSPWPTDIKLHQASRLLEVCFDDGQVFQLSCEFLRVHSPSAEVQGHSPSQKVLQVGKQQVNISAINPVGNYAVQIDFDDGHSTGIYSWRALYEFGVNYESHWAQYLEALRAAGQSRAP